MSAYQVSRWLLFVLLVTAGTVGLQADVASARPFAAETIPDYVSQVNEANLRAVATDLTSLFGPRREDVYSPFIDANCTTSSTVYPKTTLDMSADYIKAQFEAMGYPAAAITMELLPGNAGQNVFVTKLGSVYPDVFIEFSGHYDSVSSSPGGADNASGSAAVIELARVLKDYPNRYSMRFVLWAAEEYHVQRGAYYGSNYHVQQALARGEQFKAGLVMDHIGWPYPGDPTGYMNELSYNDAESERIVDLFDQVRGTYGINIGFGSDVAIQNSDEHSYWAFGQTAVSSGGGWLYYRPNYHDCGDTVANINFTNVRRAAQQNLAVGLHLDTETEPPTTDPTNTPVPGPTNTPAPTNTPGGVPGPFPSTGVLDDFNRSNGPLGADWGGDTASHTIVSNQLDVGPGEDAYWRGSSFGSDQEVYLTLTSIDPNGTEIGLILKSQSATDFNAGLIDVLYDPVGKRVQVWTFQVPQGWIQRGANLPVTFVNGDRFGVRALATGEVEVYRNGILVGERSVSAWPHSAAGGYVGLFMLSASNTIGDDFGGGSVSSTPAPTATNTPLPAPTNTATATDTPLPAPTNTATATDTPLPAPTNTATATDTPLPAPTNTATATDTPLPAPTNTATATDTPLPAPTNTATATDTPLPVPTSTATPTDTPTSVPGGFPSTGVLDGFNRSDGALDANWSGNTSDYRVVDNRLDVGATEDIYWNVSSFGPDQEAFVTLGVIDPDASEIGLVLKSQSNNGFTPGLIDVLYSPAGQVIQVWTFTDTKGWIQSGSDIAVTFSEGDRFGARARPDGQVEVYRNGTLVGTRDLIGWPFAASGGYVGIFNLNAGSAVLDDFGGGTASNP